MKASNNKPRLDPLSKERLQEVLNLFYFNREIIFGFSGIRTCMYSGSAGKQFASRYSSSVFFQLLYYEIYIIF